MPHKMEFGWTGCKIADANSIASYGDTYQPHLPGKNVEFYVATCKRNSELKIALLALTCEKY